MSTIIPRLLILLLVALVTYGLVWVVRRFVASQQLAALSYQPSTLSTAGANMPQRTSQRPAESIRILAFSSPDCRQCHQMQTPALQRVVNARGDDIKVIDIDATTEPELVKTYRVLTVPSTVILDQGGHAHAVNYGFANTQRLLQQVDELLAKA